MGRTVVILMFCVLRSLLLGPLFLLRTFSAVHFEVLIETKSRCFTIFGFLFSLRRSSVVDIPFGFDCLYLLSLSFSVELEGLDGSLDFLRFDFSAIESS